MAYQNAMDALNLNMPRKVPRTEYSASSYWSLVSAVTGIPSRPRATGRPSPRVEAFEKAWDFGFTWSVLIHNQVLAECRTSMGHAVRRGRSRYEPQHTVPV